MGKEIERKFLVKEGTDLMSLGSPVRITQGYLSSVKERTVRVRFVEGKQGLLTIKGMGNDSGTTRFEWESTISLDEADDLLKLCEPGVIDKTRTKIKVGKHTFEVDCFKGDNQGLVIAEVELESENEEFEKPDWLGEEVTGDPKYYNSMLSKTPYKSW